MTAKHPKIGLALGGGGARGFAHIGVLRVLEQEKIHLDVIVGTSSGALVGGAYACGISPDELERTITRYLDSQEFQTSVINALRDAQDKKDRSLVARIQHFVKNKFILLQALFKPGLLSAGDFQTMINTFIPDISIQDTRIPFRAVATDLVSGRQIVFSEGSLREAVMASSAVPGAIQPVKKEKYLLSDGGIMAAVPVTAALNQGVEHVIAVSVEKDLTLDEELKAIQDIFIRANDITSHYLSSYELSRADVVIRPRVGTMHWTDFTNAGPLIREGEQAARESMEEIRFLLPGIRKWFTPKYLAKRLRKRARPADIFV